MSHVLHKDVFKKMTISAIHLYGLVGLRHIILTSLDGNEKTVLFGKNSKFFNFQPHPHSCAKVGTENK